MARPLEFEYVIRSEDPDGDFERLLAVQPSAAALETVKRAAEIHRHRTRAKVRPIPEDPDTSSR